MKPAPHPSPALLSKAAGEGEISDHQRRDTDGRSADIGRDGI